MHGSLWVSALLGVIVHYSEAKEGVSAIGCHNNVGSRQRSVTRGQVSLGGYN